MKDIPGITFGEKETARATCRVAYTLNNAQPVVCTIIGDQPLFYMDFDIEEDEALFSDHELGLFEKELDTLRDHIAALEKASFLETAQSTEERISEFKANVQGMIRGREKQAGDMNALKEILSNSRLAKAYLDFAAEYKVEIEFSAQIDKAFYDRRAGKIFINPHIDFTDMQLLCVRELRRHWQHRQGALIHPLMFHPDNAVLVNRAQVADLAVSMVRIGWELQLSGHKDVWERIESSTMSDLARSFAREAFLDFRTINNGQAAAAVFESWFLSERCRQQDKALIQQMLADYQGYVFDIDQALQTITPDLIAALGSMPYGKNYLAQYAATILNDPVFTEIRDRSNANFLWFIKFERTFKETEQELQTEEHPAATGLKPGATATSKELRHEKTGPSAKIVSLYSAVPSRKAAAGSGKNGAGAEIVYLRRWPGENK